MRLQAWLQHLHLARRADPPSASWCRPLHSPPRWTLAATRTIVAWSALCTRQNALLYRRCHVTARPTHLRAAAGRTATHRAAPQRAILGAKLAKTNSLTAGSAELRGAEASSATPRAATATVPSIATQQAAWLLPSKGPVQQLQLLTAPRRKQQPQSQPHQTPVFTSGRTAAEATHTASNKAQGERQCHSCGSTASYAFSSPRDALVAFAGTQAPSTSPHAAAG